MYAIIRTKAGKEFSSMQLQEMESPSPQAGEVKIKMKASRINPVDMDLMKGFPSLKYKKPQIGGVDGAGEVLEVGAGVSHFQIGDPVFFYRKFTDIGTWAEKITIAVQDIAHIPKNLAVEEAGAIALPLLTAYESLQALQAQAGESILIHGAGGGVGFQTVQLAKAMGLKVIANASSRDKEKLEKLGLEAFIDYRSTDFTQLLAQNVPEYVLDVIGKDTLLKSIALGPRKVVSIAFPDTQQMHKTGIKLPGIFKFLMNMMNRKFVKAAKQYGVELIGQVTGANGKQLAAAARLIERSIYTAPEFQPMALSEIQERGLSKADLGKVILFD